MTACAISSSAKDRSLRTCGDSDGLIAVVSSTDFMLFRALRRLGSVAVCEHVEVLGVSVMFLVLLFTRRQFTHHSWGRLG